MILPSWRVIVGVLAVPLAAAAQSQPGEGLVAGREVVVTGASGEHPVVVYGIANVVVELVFDAPVQRTDAGLALRLASGDARLHPFLDNALLVTPSHALSASASIPLHVSLTDGGVPLVLAFSPERMDHVLRILRRPPAPDGGTEVTGAERRELLSGMASVVLGNDGCAPIQSSRIRSEEVSQLDPWRRDARVCVAGTFSYLDVMRLHPACAVASARFLRQGQDVEVLLLEPAELKMKTGDTRQKLVVRTPPEKAEDFVLELLAADGTVCERYEGLTLQPGGAR